MTVNRYTKLIKTLKEAPTNSMGGVYSLNTQGYRYGQPDKPKKFYPDIDGNFTDGIPGNPGDPFYLRPEGFWDGGSDWGDGVQRADASQNYLLEDPTGTSTSGLIAEDGTVKSPLPPDSRHFILGPLVDGYVPNHGYDNYTNIGYLQKDTRQFVLLARIQGQFTADLYEPGARVWDGTEGQLTVINSNFTLAMAEWMKERIVSGNYTSNIPYFYSGGVPQQPPDCPNCPPGMLGGNGPGIGGGNGTGSGTPPNLGSGPNPNPPNQSGGPDDVGAPFPDNPDNPNPPPDPPPEPPEEPPEKPWGSLTAGFATIDSAIAAEAGLGIILTVGAAIGWLLQQLFNASSAAVGGLAAAYRWKPGELSTLSKYAADRSRQTADAMATSLSNDEWEKQAERGRQQDAQDAKDANERSRQAEEELKRAEESGDQERIDRAEEAQRNAERNQERVRNNNSRNRQQRSQERRNRGLTQQGGQGREKGATINDKPFSAEGLKSVKKLILEQGGATPTPSPSGSGGPGPSNPGGGSGGEGLGGAGRTYYVTEKNATLTWLTGESVYFTGGYIQGSVENGNVDHIVKGTTLKTETIVGLSSAVDKAKTAQTAAHKAASDHWTNVASPKITSLLAQAEAYLSSEGWGFLRANQSLYEIDQVYKVYEGYQRRAMNSSAEYLSSLRSLGSYVQNGRLLTRLEYDPLSLDDVIPDEPDEDEDKDKDEKIQEQLDKLMQENDELAQAQALNKLKALGWGALMAGGIIVGAAVLAKPAIVGALGLGLVRTLRALIKTKPIPRPPSTPKTPTTPKPTAPKKPTDPRFRIDEPLGDGKGVGFRGKYDQFGREINPATGKPLSNSYEPNRRKKILSEIRKPVKVKEAPTKYKMNFSGKFSAQNTPDKTASQKTNDLVSKANAHGQSWRMDDKRWSGYETTERMNIIQDRTGHGKQAFDYMVEQGTQRSEWRTREVQEELNKIAHERAMLKENPNFTSPFGNIQIDMNPTTPKNKKNFDSVNRIKNMAADKATQKMMSQITPEYPSKPPAVPDEVTGLHPKLKSGENASAYYKRLDPTSADSMPDAAYPQIDNLRDKARKKRK